MQIFQTIAALLIICQITTNSLTISRNYNSNNPFKNYKQYLVARSSNYTAYNKPDCPGQCVCKGLSIDCSNRNLVEVPKKIPFNVIRV